MKGRIFGRGLPGLILIGAILAGSVGATEMGRSAPLSGPSGWVRVDGQDHDLDEMLSLLRPHGAETLAIFAPAQNWKPFYDKIYGRTPIDLTFYAAIYSLSFGGSDPPNLNDWTSFYQQTPTASRLPEESSDPSTSKVVTFRTTIVPAGEDGYQGENKTVYTVFASLILTGRRVFFLNLFQIDPYDPAELERLALTWRAEFMETPAQVEESRSE